MKGQTRPGDQINTVLDQAFCAGLARSAYIFLFHLYLDNDLERVGAGRTAIQPPVAQCEYVPRRQ